MNVHVPTMLTKHFSLRHLCTRWIPGFALLLTPMSAFADIQSVVDTVGGMLPVIFSNDAGCFSVGTWSFACIVGGIVGNMRLALVVVAVFVIVLAGFRMIVTQDEEILTKARNIISAALTGIMMAYLIEPFLQAFYVGPFSGIVRDSATAPEGGALSAGAIIVTREVMGVIQWILVIVAVLAILMIIVSGLRAMAKAGSEEGLTDIRQTVFRIIAGILLIVFSQVMVRVFGIEPGADPTAPTIVPLASAIATVLTFFLSFLALIAVVIVVYAGFLLILNFGNEEQITKAKSLLIRALIGVVVIAVSFAIVKLVVEAVTGETA